jgi:hypothetical protein
MANDGGSAFPITQSCIDSFTQQRVNVVVGGMSLRDYFAAVVLEGQQANPECGGTPAEYAACAYEMADAMLAERTRAK